MLLILTSDKDLTADFLIVELIKRRLPYFRLNAEELTAAQFTFSLAENSVARTISTGSRTLDLDDVTAVWYRRVIQPGFISALPPGERTFVAGEMRHLATGLVLNPDVTWVNPIDRVYVAEHKLYQLRIARQLGFQVPRTLVSSDPAELRKFSQENAAGTICKPIFHGMFVDETSAYSVYTRRVTPESIDTESVKSCPVLLQEEIPRSGDVRATFIGSKCFVAEIRGDSSLIDWRDPGVSVRYSESSLRPEAGMGFVSPPPPPPLGPIPPPPHPAASAADALAALADYHASSDPHSSWPNWVCATSDATTEAGQSNVYSGARDQRR